MLKLPNEFIEKYKKLLGPEKSQKFFEAIDSESKKGFRLNPLKYDYQNVSYDLSQPIPGVEEAFYGNVSGHSSDWIGGYVYSQDPAAMYPAQIANVQPGERVLDLCAAPGGKSTALAQKLANQGILVANEISTKRASNLRENLERWGATNVLITNESPEDLARVFPQYFSKIVVDAPCSGEGMFRKDHDAIQYWSQDYVLACQTRQKEILTEAVKMLEPGGELIYSTCTFSPEEDEEIVEWLVTNYEFEIQELEKVPGMSPGNPAWTKSGIKAINKTGRFWFQDGVGEGQFVARLKNVAATSVNQRPATFPVTKTTKKHSKKGRSNNLQQPTKNEIELIAKVLNNFDLPRSLKNWQDKVYVRKDHVFVPIISPTKLSSLRILSNGVELGLMKKNRFEPGHQLAEVLAQVKQNNVIELVDEKQFQAYLHGETIKVETSLRGFVLVSFEKHIISFGKVGNDEILKNYYPKGLRK